MKTKRCLICHNEYTPVNAMQRYCKDCRANRMEDIAKTWKCKQKKEEKKKQSYGKSLDEMCKDIHEYNKKHGTNFTYGKYMEKLYAGTLKIG